MPTLFVINGYEFRFYAREGFPREPIHVHVDKAGATAKFWMDPEVRLSRSRGYTSKQLRDIEAIAQDRAGQIVEAWNAYFGS